MTEDPPIQATPGIDVFVSYASQDTAAANAIVEALERDGLKCWIAPRDVRAGAQYADAIVRAISGAKVFVLVLSANASASSHVGKEIERASSKKRPIIALRIDAAPLTPALEYFLSESQWIEAQAGMMEAAYAKLIDATREPALNSIPAMAPGASARRGAALHTKSRRNQILIVAGLAVVAVTLAALWSANFRPAEQVTAEQSTTAAETAVSERSIAVLPFADMSADKNQEFMSDGIAEEILTVLSQVPDLKVIARTSSFSFKEQSLDIAEIAKRLNVAHVLEGSVRTSGNKLRITAQLIHAADSTRIWSNRYDRQIDDIFVVQDEIANAIVQALQLRLTTGALTARQGGSENLGAYQLYLRAGDALSEGTQPSLDRAADYLQEAIKRDPDFARAWSRLAMVSFYNNVYGYEPTREAFQNMQEYTSRALELHPDIAEAHSLLQIIHIFTDFNWKAAETEGQRALALDPNDPFVFENLAQISSVFGEHAKAIRLIEASLERDPSNLSRIDFLADIYYHAGRFTQAEGALRSLLEKQPNRQWARTYLSRALLAQGHAESALTMIEQEPDEGARHAYMPIMLQAVGRRADANKALETQLDYWAKECASCIARTYAYRGDKDRAFEWLERAYRQKDPALLNILDEPLYANVADDPRFEAFVRDRLKVDR